MYNFKENEIKELINCVEHSYPSCNLTLKNNQASQQFQDSLDKSYYSTVRRISIAK